MSNSKDFKQALLAQNGLQAGHLPDQRRKEIELMLERDIKRVRQMRWVTAGLWLLWISLYVGFAIAGVEPRRIDSILATVLFLIWMALLPAAIVSSISLYVRWRAANFRELRARLDRLEEHLRSLSGQR